MRKRKFCMSRVAGLVLLLWCFGSSGVVANDGPSPSGDGPRAPAASAPETGVSDRDEIATLKQQMALQQNEIDRLEKTLDELSGSTAVRELPARPAEDATIGRGQDQSDQPDASSTPRHALSTQRAARAANRIDYATTPLVAPSTGFGPSISSGQATASPLQIRLGDATLTPLGFLDLTGVFRTHAAGGSIGTSFGSIPYGTSYQTNLSEFRLSMQNSRVGFRADADVKGAHVIGYMEADFLGNNGTSVAVSSNSNTLRSRLYWVDISKGKWELLGGQSWSLVTPGRVGISPVPGDLFYTQDMDTNYQAGLVWGRIPELRVVYHPSKKVAFAVAIDSPDQYAGGSSGGGAIVLPAAINTVYSSELDFGTSSGGLGAPNVAPDVIAKLAFDPATRVHFEVGGVERTFRVWYPGTSTTPAATYSAEGGGGFLNLGVQLARGLRLVTNNFWSDGGGRYIFGQAPDLAIRANGTISLLHSASALTGFEFTHRNTSVFAYYGGIYIGRDSIVDTNGKLVGYGYAGSANAQNRTIQEGTLGFNQAIWKNPNYGAVNVIGQYSFLERNPWSVATGAPANAEENMVFFDLRYTLPGSAPTISSK